MCRGIQVVSLSCTLQAISPRQSSRSGESPGKSRTCSVQGADNFDLPSKDVRSHTSTHKTEYVSGAVNILELSVKSSINVDFYASSNHVIETIIRKLVLFNARLKNKIDTGYFVEGVIRKDLSPREMTIDGFIYIYWFLANFGHIKIGVTNRSVEVRRQEWKRQCGHEPKLVYPVSEDQRQRVPHVYRVEAIAQSELRKRRRKEFKCNTCHRAHQEWFEKSAPAAIAAIKKIVGLDMERAL